MKHLSFAYRKTCVLNYIQKWFCYITENKQHLDLSFDSMKDLLSNSGLNISSEIEVFHAGHFWIKHAPKARNKFATELSKSVRLPLLSSAALDLLLKNDSSFAKYLKNNNHVKQLTNNLEDKPSTTSAKEYQNRYYTPDSFIVAADNDFDSYEYRRLGIVTEDGYKIYEYNENISTKEVGFVKTEESVSVMLRFNGLIYLLCDRSIKSYSISTKTLKYLSNHGTASSACVCFFMGKIYIFGEKHYAVYDTKRNALETSGTVKEVRRNAACAVFGGKIIVSGGMDLEIQELKRVEAFDHCANEWSQMPDVLGVRYNHASISIRNKLYMVGGSSEQCEVFDSLNRNFVYIKSPAFNYKGLKTPNVAIGNKIGFYNEDSFDAVVFDFETGEWSEEKDLELSYEPFERFLYC